MVGDVGYRDVAQLLAEAGSSDAWFELRSRLWNVPSAEGRDTPPLVRAWIADGCPKRRGRDYAAFFLELDGWSEYWDLYHPKTRGLYHFGDGSRPGHLSAFLPSPTGGPAPVFDAWKAWALASRDERAETKARRRFEKEVQGRREVEEAAIAVEALVDGLVEKHFGDSDGDVDADAYFDALDRFATDVLPACPERYERVADDDPRKASSLYHLMAGDIMWFAWATHLACAELTAPDANGKESLRALLMAGVALGCSMDFAFTGRARTRERYEAADEAAWRAIWATARKCARDFETAAAEVRDLFFIRTFDDG
jgi:hypothetical protein